mmetsp:Transcript_11783/g.25535  ORF Transcript_11783/g.25535 Transcript_11783/m.25535 type:complete len:123 (-) Transcript_11783:8-376(-)
MLMYGTGVAKKFLVPESARACFPLAFLLCTSSFCLLLEKPMRQLTQAVYENQSPEKTIIWKITSGPRPSFTRASRCRKQLDATPCVRSGSSSWKNVQQLYGSTSARAAESFKQLTFTAATSV